MLEILSSTKGCDLNNCPGESGLEDCSAHPSAKPRGAHAVTEGYFEKMVNLANCTAVERARYFHRTLGGVIFKRLQSMAAQKKVEGVQ